MIYVMSDIHGEYDRYKAMLEKIQFSDDDTMYIIGDVIDRKPGGVDILKDIVTRTNVKFLIGNHEQMMLNDVFYHIPGARELWRANGGSQTRRALLYKTDHLTQSRIIRYLIKAPDRARIEINGRTFYLVHGWPANHTYDRIWTRPEPDMKNPFPDCTLIIGHTPVWYLGQRQNPLHIEHTPEFIDIDCGCGNDIEERRLACLRLDDMAEFYT